MSETTVTCSKCGKCVPKKRFCFDCGASLELSVNQPTTSQGDKASTPVSDSASLEASKLAKEQTTDVVTNQPTFSSTTTSRIPNEKTNGTPSSYAEASAVRSRPSDEGSQQNNQAGRVSNNGPAGSPGKAGNKSVTELNNDVTAATDVAGGANKASEKVIVHNYHNTMS